MVWFVRLGWRVVGSVVRDRGRGEIVRLYIKELGFLIRRFLIFFLKRKIIGRVFFEGGFGYF